MCAKQLVNRGEPGAAAARVTRALRALAEGNRALLRALDEDALFAQVCEVLIDRGGYQLAWIGLRNEGDPRCVKGAGSGPTLENRELVAQLWRDQCEGRGLVALAMAAGQPRSNDGVMVIPLPGDPEAVGVICLHGRAGEIVETDVVEILTELAGDIVFGLGLLHARTAKDPAALAADEALRKQARMNAALFNQAITNFVLLDRNYRFVKTNESWARSFHKSPSDFVGRTMTEVLTAYRSEEPTYNQMLDAVVKTKKPLRYYARPFIFHDQPERDITYWDSIIEPILDENGEVEFLFFSSIDVTERKRAEEALRDSERRFLQVTEAIGEVFWLTEVAAGQTTVVYVSPAYERIWGRSCTSLYADSSSWLQAVHPDDRERVQAVTRNLLAGDNYALEYRVVHPDGSVRWIHDRAFPIHDEAGGPRRFAGVAADITERRTLEEQVRQAQKMEAVGQLAGGIAHDFNNVLLVVQLQASLLLSGPEISREVRDGLQEILAAGERAANLTRQLLTFGRRETRRAKDIDLAVIAGNMMRLLRRLLGADITLESRFAPALPLVHADPGMIEQVIMNLALNARDAMPRGGRLTFSLDLVDIDEDYVAAHPRSSRGQFACLSATDTGSGIAPEILPRIFEPFFTTKAAGKGTGLGLATVFGIVTQHQGWIDVTSEVGRGTTFRAYLPAIQGTIQYPRARGSEPALPFGNETIMLVEDDPNVRKVARAALEQQGYRVIEASSGAAALQLAQSPAADADLLLTDLVLPGGVTGRELVSVLLDRRPGLKVVYTSGYSADLVHEQMHLDPGRNFLQKPYPITDLARTVRRCLDEC